MQVVDICRALYKISTGTPVSRGPSATAGLLVHQRLGSEFATKSSLKIPLLFIFSTAVPIEMLVSF